MDAELVSLLTTLALAGGPAPSALASDTSDLRQALERAISQSDARPSMVLVVECRKDARLSAMKVLGNGIGIWNNERQFHLEEGAIISLLRTLRDMDFPGLSERYGGAPDAPPKPDVGGAPGAGYAVTVTCRIDLALSGHHKEVVQLARGEQSPILKRLAESLLRIGEAPARSGLAASSLQDGLKSIARGQLAPETWVIMLHRKPGGTGAPDRARRFLLTIAGSRATTRIYVPADGHEKEFVLDLTPDDIRNLARELAASDPAAWPVNLYAREYTDLSLMVLNHERSVQARQFAGLQPTTHGDHQAAFEHVVAALHRLHQRVVARSRPAAQAPIDTRQR